MLRLSIGEEVTRQQVKRGTVRRMLQYVKRYRWALGLLLVVTAVDSGITVANPLLLGMMIDNGILPHKLAVLIELTAATAGLALVDTLAMFVQTWCSAWVGQGLILTLRTQVFRHVQQQPLAFLPARRLGRWSAD
jgi:ATP-binding cassette subfamily B protein